MNLTSLINHICVIGLSGMVASAVYAEDGKKPATAIERFSADSGEVVVKGFEDIGRLDCEYRYKGVVGIARFTNAESGNVISGLRISVEGPGQYDSAKLSFVDYEEIDGLVAGVTYLEGVDKSVTPLEDVEAMFSTEGGLEVTVFSGRDGEISAAITVGKYSSENCYLAEGGLGAAKELILSAKERLDSI